MSQLKYQHLTKIVRRVFTPKETILLCILRIVVSLWYRDGLTGKVPNVASFFLLFFKVEPIVTISR